MSKRHAAPGGDDGPNGALAGTPLQDDLDLLRRVEQRFAGTEAERRMLEAVRGRLPEGLAARVEGFVGHPAPLFVLGLHGLFATLGGVIGLRYPGLGALACLLTAASLVGEGTGRLGLLRLWLPKVPSYNLVVPPPDEQAGVHGTVVLSTPLDIPRARAPRLSRPRRPVLVVFGTLAGMIVLLLLRMVAEPLQGPLLGLYMVCVGGMAATSVLVWLSRREPRHVEADAGGPAVVLELLRRLEARPLPGVAVWTVFTGCGRAHQDGMQAFLTLRGERLPPPVLVVSLQDPARPTLRATLSEGPLWPQHHLPTGPALVERLQWAGVRVPHVDRAEPTDARAAMILGYRGLGLVGGRGEPSADAAQRASDITETVLRWHAEDLGRVAEDRAEVAGWAQGARSSA